MFVQRGMGVIMLVVGFGLLFCSHFIQNQVLEGNQKIAKAQNQLDTGGKIWSIHPITRGIGKRIAKAAQAKIDAGKQKAIKYERIANYLKIGGVTVVLMGSGLLCFFGRKQEM